MHNQFKTQKFKHLMLAMGPRDLNSAPYSPVHCSSHSMTSFQSSELTELPVVENSQLFAQRTVRPLGGPNCCFIAPHGFAHSHCHQMISQHWPKSPWGLSEATQKSHFLNQPMPA